MGSSPIPGSICYMNKRFLDKYGDKAWGYAIVLDYAWMRTGEVRIDLSELDDLICESTLVCWDRDGVADYITLNGDIGQILLYHNRGQLDNQRSYSDGIDAWYFYKATQSLGSAFCRFLVKEMKFEFTNNRNEHGLGR